MFLDSISPSFVAAEIYTYELNQFFDFYIEDIPKIKEKYQKIAYASKLINMISVKESEPIRIGGKIPNFTLPTADGKSISPQDFKGRYLLVDFWASWCGPCRNEVPNVAKAYAKYKSKGFEVLGISTDTDPEKWKSAIKQLNMTWTSVRDVKGEASHIFNIEFIPTVYLVGPDGTILADQVRGERLEELLKKYLGE
jgi:peroxiredoxin